MLNLVWGHQLQSQIHALKQEGIPLSIKDLNLPAIPDDQNAVELYRRAFVLMTTGGKGKPFDGKHAGTLNQTFDKIVNLKLFKSIRSKNILSEWNRLPPEEKQEIAALLENPDVKEVLRLVDEAFNALLTGVRMSGQMKVEPLLITQLRRAMRSRSTRSHPSSTRCWKKAKEANRPLPYWEVAMRLDLSMPAGRL